VANGDEAPTKTESREERGGINGEEHPTTNRNTKDTTGMHGALELGEHSGDNNPKKRASEQARPGLTK